MSVRTIVRTVTVIVIRLLTTVTIEYIFRMIQCINVVLPAEDTLRGVRQLETPLNQYLTRTAKYVYTHTRRTVAFQFNKIMKFSCLIWKRVIINAIYRDIHTSNTGARVYIHHVYAYKTCRAVRVLVETRSHRAVDDPVKRRSTTTNHVSVCPSGRYPIADIPGVPHHQLQKETQSWKVTFYA